MTSISTGILKGPKSARPAPDELEDGSQWLVTNAGDGNARELTEVRDGAWVSVPWKMNELNAKSLGTESVTINKGLSREFSSAYPHAPRGPELSTTYTLAPHPEVSNPVLTVSDVTDTTGVTGVADPFLVPYNGSFHLFFEIERTGTDYVGHATSDDGLTWTYNQTVWTSKRAAYPHVFRSPVDGEWYMTPAPNLSTDLYLLKSDSFPDSWSEVNSSMISNTDLTDPTPFFWPNVADGDGRWYMLVWDTSDHSTRLFYADDLVNGSWIEHPESPVVTGNPSSTPAGRPIVRNSYVDYPDKSVGMRRLTGLSTTSATVTPISPNKILKETGNSWNANELHHMDAVLPETHGTGVVVVDGNDGNEWSLGIYTPSVRPRGVGRTHLSSDQTGISGDGSANQITFDTLNHQIGEAFAGASGTEKYSARKEGYYKITAVVTVTSLPATPFTLSLRLNTTSSFDVKAFPQKFIPSQANRYTIRAETQMYLPENESVAANIIQDSGSNITVEGGEAKTYLEGEPLW